ncbi:MAG: class I SAM-dependent methyltransferase [Phycisphaerales bacterium JB037]
MGAESAETIKQTWSAHLRDELGFWSDWFRTKGKQWPQLYKDRLDPDLPLQARFIRCLAVPAGGTARILDVGAGPLTLIGKKWEGRRVELVPTDALADGYDRLMAEFGVEPPVRTIACEAEKLEEKFGEGSFDLSHAQNSLDHCYDPMLAIRQMIAVTKPGGFVLLNHNLDEAEQQEYGGLHQWNFAIRDGRAVIWNREGSRDIAEELGAGVEVESELRGEGNWVSVTIRRLGS